MLTPILFNLLIQATCLDVIVLLPRNSSALPESSSVVHYLYRGDIRMDGKHAALLRVPANDLLHIYYTDEVRQVVVPKISTDAPDGFVTKEELELLNYIFKNPSEGLDSATRNAIESVFINPIEGWKFIPWNEFGDPALYPEPLRQTAREVSRKIARTTGARIVAEGIIKAHFRGGSSAGAIQFAITFEPTEIPGEIAVRFIFVKDPDNHSQYFERYWPPTPSSPDE